MRNGVRIAGNAQNAQTMMRLSIVKMPLLPLSNKKGEKQGAVKMKMPKMPILPIYIKNANDGNS